MYFLLVTEPYKKSSDKILRNNIALKKRVLKALKILAENPLHPSLKSHKVNTSYHGVHWTSWVTGDIRIIWDYDESNKLVILLLDIGSHSGKHNVYK